MILYLFNNPFPDNAGFAKRCKKEIAILAETEKIVVLCKKNPNDKQNELLKIGSKQVQIIRFSTFFNSNSNATHYKILKGFYEMYRNIDLLFGMVKELLSIYSKNLNIKLYVVVSPLTVPLIAYLTGLLFKVKPLVLEFHDLEPEMAMHIKSLDKKSIITKIEFALEKLVCSIYEKIIVTTTSQKDRIVESTGVNINKILVIPNSIQVEDTENTNVKTKQNNELLVGYVSSFSYAYSISTFLGLISLIEQDKSDFKNIKFQIVGDGSLLQEVKNKVMLFHLENKFIFSGRVTDVSNIIQEMDIALIPWKQDAMTETMAPTKLFEYMEAKKAIIAPNYGEFKNILSHNTNALLYNSNNELLEFIKKLKEDKKSQNNLGENAYKLYEQKYKKELISRKLLDFVEA